MRHLLACALVGVAASCGGGRSEDASGGLAGAPNLRIFLSDSPVDEADAVYVLIDRVEVVRIEDGVETFVVAKNEMLLKIAVASPATLDALGEHMEPFRLREYGEAILSALRGAG